MEVNYDIAPLTKHITQATIDLYAEASGDYNPIHVDPGFAAGTPFGGTIAHGMLLIGYISELLTGRFGLDWLGRGEMRVRFKLPARPGDAVTTRARLRQSGEAGGNQRVSYSITCENQRGETLVLGEASVGI